MMESIDKLREVVAKGKRREYKSADGYYREIGKAVGEIEREIADNYMKLPLDADGVPIKMGDEVSIPRCYEGIVVSIEVGDMETLIGVDCHDGYLRYGNSSIRHVKPRTIEDVLYEFAEAVRHERIECAELSESSIADFAAEIREITVRNIRNVTTWEFGGTIEKMAKEALTGVDA